MSKGWILLSSSKKLSDRYYLQILVSRSSEVLRYDYSNFEGRGLQSTNFDRAIFVSQDGGLRGPYILDYTDGFEIALNEYDDSYDFNSSNTLMITHSGVVYAVLSGKFSEPNSYLQDYLDELEVIHVEEENYRSFEPSQQTFFDENDNIVLWFPVRIAENSKYIFKVEIRDSQDLSIIESFEVEDLYPVSKPVNGRIVVAFGKEIGLFSMEQHKLIAMPTKCGNDGCFALPGSDYSHVYLREEQKLAVCNGSSVTVHDLNTREQVLQIETDDTNHIFLGICIAPDSKLLYLFSRRGASVYMQGISPRTWSFSGEPHKLNFSPSGFYGNRICTRECDDKVVIQDTVISLKELEIKDYTLLDIDKGKYARVVGNKLIVHDIRTKKNREYVLPATGFCIEDELDDHYILTKSNRIITVKEDGSIAHDVSVKGLEQITQVFPLGKDEWLISGETGGMLICGLFNVQQGDLRILGEMLILNSTVSGIVEISKNSFENTDRLLLTTSFHDSAEDSIADARLIPKEADHPAILDLDWYIAVEKKRRALVLCRSIAAKEHPLLKLLNKPVTILEKTKK